MKPIILASCIVLLLILNACAPVPKWKIYTTETARNESISSNSTEGQSESISELKNTILLNNETGQTWLLWPNENGYSWQELEKQGSKRGDR